MGDERQSQDSSVKAAVPEIISSRDPRLLDYSFYSADRRFANKRQSPAARRGRGTWAYAGRARPAAQPDPDWYDLSPYAGLTPAFS
jgi:hypothetical protein